MLTDSIHAEPLESCWRLMQSVILNFLNFPCIIPPRSDDSTAKHLIQMLIQLAEKFHRQQQEEETNSLHLLAISLDSFKISPCCALSRRHPERRWKWAKSGRRMRDARLLSRSAMKIGFVGPMNRFFCAIPTFAHIFSRSFAMILKKNVILFPFGRSDNNRLALSRQREKI